MREIIYEMELSKKRVFMLKNKTIGFKVNKGRNKFITFNGYIDNLYPSIFTVKAMLDNKEVTLSFSYSDVLTKNIMFYQKCFEPESAFI